MSIQIKIDEMLDILEHLDHPQFEAFKGMTESLAKSLAIATAEAVPELVFTGKASFEGTAFAGTCATFEPKGPYPIPDVLVQFDIEVQQWHDLMAEMGYEPSA